ncbi:hypothetical protein HYH02_011301 [Chlamydomonas schloesseri]|uniref:tRNA ligase phosphodiesterase domain-containing protein n=1 Tax=Chlamydomonas schloesseri TaxID=2026947 RepID=A0A835W4J1_9CHLO|nr:hypothetical protein HYH02_011301 [Chlamydomonas schloesseri]|eukprot:KAG2437038.1 hypothetical protein HYH02_011301 [Chlamydomonas schloesseri]
MAAEPTSGSSGLGPVAASPPAMTKEAEAALLLVQNMHVLGKQLRLPISYKVLERVQPKEQGAEEGSGGAMGADRRRVFGVVVHVHGDHAFKKYLQNCSSSDLLLYRGLLLQVETTADVSAITAARVQQAFLPKFENEGQDAAVADAVVAAATPTDGGGGGGMGTGTGRPTVVTIKHSGSLVTLSWDGGWAAKNSVANEFTAGGAALLRAHYDRRNPGNPAAAAAELQRLFDVMRQRRLCFSFEMVTSSHGHHGQLPAAEYLVATAAHGLDPATSAPAFLGWLPFLELCAELGLPANDTWLLAGGPMAAAARQALDVLALRGGPTAAALAALRQLVEEGAQTEPGCLHLPGAYPHDQWQGSRLEGFVVAAGQPLGEEELRRLRAVREAMAAARLPLPDVPQHLRSPYQTALKAALAAEAEAAAGAGGGAGVSSAGDGAAAPQQQAQQQQARVKARLQAAAGVWVPQSAVPYSAAAGEVKGRLEELLAGQAIPSLADAPHPYLALSGGGRLYGRRALGRLGTPRLQALLEAEAQAADGAGGGEARAAALREVAAAVAMAEDPTPDPLLVRAMRALAGGPEAAATLRYKKKMLMWTWPSAATAPAAATAATAAATAATADGGGVVGYSLMTFVLRNGLPALRQGAATYAAYVENLTRRSWGLPAGLAGQVQHFARCWAAWVGARGGAEAVDAYRYLDVAEPFAAEFLARRGAMAVSGRAEGAFQGVLICVDTPEPLTAALRRALAPSAELSAARLDANTFSKAMVPGGAMLWLQPGGEMPKMLRAFLNSGAAPFTWVVAAAPARGGGGGAGDGPDAKRQKGIAESKVRTVTSALGADGAASRLRQVVAPAPEDDADGAATARLAAELAAWLGRGSPLPRADPAVAAYFVTIPGAGKSAMTRWLEQPAERGALEAGGKVSVKVLNSDTMKRTVKGFNPNRYWQEVAAATDACLGGGHVSLAVADKNLVPSPPGNIARALEPLKGLPGVATLALVPVVRGPSTASAPAPAHQAAGADLYGGLPDLPFPLELVALCMMRTLQRKNHEGGLDGASAPAAATVVAMFAGFYRHKTLSELTSALRDSGLFTHVAELPIMNGDGAAEAGGGGGAVPLDVLQHVAVGLRDVNERAKPQLPAEWEARARELLLRPDTVAALQGLQRGLSDVREDMEKVLGAAVQTAREAAAAAAAAANGGGAAGADGGAGGGGGTIGLMTEPSLSADIADLAVAPPAAAAAEGGGATAATGAAAAAAAALDEEKVAYFSVAGLDEEALRAAARSVLPEPLHARLRRGALHVTLWHRNDAGTGGSARPELRRALMELLGSPVELEVAALDVSPEVVAAQVTLLSADEAVTAKSYHHITLLVEKGHTAAEANQLPARLAAGEPGVERRPLPGGPLQLAGVITAVAAEEPAAAGAGGTPGVGGKRPPVM